MELPSSLLSLVGAILLLVASCHGDAFEHTKCCNCDSLMPESVPDGASAQVLPSPFKIEVEEDSYKPGQEIHVNLVASGIDTFRSFILVAYTHSSMNSRKRIPRGQLILASEGYEVIEACDHNDVMDGRSFAVMSKDRLAVQNLKFIWRPSNVYGHIEFRATFVKNDEVFWVKEKSKKLYDESIEMPPRNGQRYTRPINTQQCGKTKGCYREPAGCVEPQCLYILTWTSDAQNVNFELGGLTRGSADTYVSVAFSDDTDVGDDTVFVCAHSLQYDSTEVYVGHYDDYEVTMMPKYETTIKDGKYERVMQKPKYKNIILREEGSFQNNRLQCRFTVNRHLDIYKNLRSLRKGPVHLIMANGYADSGFPDDIGAGHDEFPHVSEDKIDLNRYGNSDGRASYPLVKAHGCLMILAWVLFSSVGFLLAKYYQPMWPEKRWYEKKYWFMGHFKCMAMVFILVIIGVILIFIEAGGYSKARDLPYEAHPILGIIILVCVLLLPLIGLLRPSPGHKCRPVFNWMYWIFATIANVLAIPNIFIGMDFGKAMVPWWATWILVIWVIFHIVVEITLEVHQCMTHKKNKERRKKHELLKRDYPKQHHPMPEPAGRRFKRFMLMLHLAITILIVLIMIIVIAVS